MPAKCHAITVEFVAPVRWRIEKNGKRKWIDIPAGVRFSGVTRAHVVEGREVFDLTLANGGLLRCVPYSLVSICDG